MFVLKLSLNLKFGSGRMEETEVRVSPVIFLSDSLKMGYYYCIVT